MLDDGRDMQQLETVSRKRKSDDHQPGALKHQAKERDHRNQ